jgi:bifunctional oligoribonuclease and PAP phosphatase NrnA
MQTLSPIIIDKQNIAILGHANVDGDCLGSMLSLAMILRKQGKKVDTRLYEKPRDSFSFVPEIESIHIGAPKGDYDLIIYTDFSPHTRYGTREHIDGFKHIPLLIIDHHIDDNPDVTRNIKDANAASNCEWLREHYQAERKEYIDADIATLIYMGIMTDT